MKILALSLLTFIGLTSVNAFAGDNGYLILQSPAFNWLEYLAVNPDLPKAGLHTKVAAENHWLRYGRNECRRTTRYFDPADYLNRYSDLQRAFGQNCESATKHWIYHGRHEGRVSVNYNSRYGSVVNGTAVFGNELMRVGASRRTAGAIDSLVYRGKEFINAYDHGRQISIAYRNDTNVSGECDNPTEPGSEDDALKSTSTTQIHNLQASMDGVLRTHVTPAFWTNPNQTTPDNCKTGPRRDGRLNADDQKLSKTVRVGYKGDRQVITFDITVHNRRADVPNFQIEAPTGYLTHEFTNYYALRNDGQIESAKIMQNNRLYGDYAFKGGEQNEPGIISTPDGKFAMGAYSRSHYGVAPTYALYDFPSADKKIDTNKWSIVFRPGRLAIKDYTFRSYIVVGTLEEVRQKMNRIRAGW